MRTRVGGSAGQSPPRGPVRQVAHGLSGGAHMHISPADKLQPRPAAPAGAAHGSYCDRLCPVQRGASQKEGGRPQQELHSPAPGRQAQMAWTPAGVPRSVTWRQQVG